MAFPARLGVLYSVCFLRNKVCSRNSFLPLCNGLHNVSWNVLFVEERAETLVLYADRVRSGSSLDNFIVDIPTFRLDFS